jgi:hypothetical protein
LIVLVQERVMNSVSDTVQNRADDKVEITRPEQKTELDAELVELGKVSDTSGGWFGSKLDIGMGFLTY